MDGYGFHSLLTAEGLITEVAGGTFAFKNKIKASTVKVLWEKLGFFIAETLKSQKGVLLPNLGSFKVGPVVGESKKKIRVAFSLLEGRYGSVSQERPKFLIGGKAPVVQPSYGLLSTAAAVHRGSGQRLVAELLQRLGVHILSSRPIKVEFPCLGKLVTNRVGRIEFVFDALLSEFFEREQFAIVREMQYSPADYEIEKGLQAVSLDDPLFIKSPRGLARPVSAISGISRRERVKQQAHAPYSGSLLDLMRLCKEADRTVSGCVPRLHLEHWLHQQCRSLLSMIDAGTLMDMLDRHTYGKTNKQIVYRKFMDALDAALAKSTGFQPQVPSPAASPRDMHGQAAQQHQQPWELEYDADEAGDQGHGFGAAQNMAAGQGMMRGEASAQDLVIQVPPSPALSKPAEPDAYVHYCQNQLSPRSRADYDAFNRVHFERLHRGSQGAKRAVTPKVGEEPLNLQEYQAVRSASPKAARGKTPAARGFTPGYSDTPAQQHGQASPWAQQQLPPRQPYPQEAWGVQQPRQQEAWAAQQPRQQEQWAQQQQWAGQQQQRPQQQEPWAAPRPAEQWPGQQQPRQHQQEQWSQPAAAPYVHQPQVMQLLNPASADVSPRSEAPSRAPGRGHEQQYNILAPPPLPQRPRPQYLDAAPLSQYDIMKERDPALRAQLKEEYAAALQEGWQKQIKEKAELHGVLQEKEQAWPFGPVGVPMDKRPVSAISRPPASPRRGNNKTPR